MIPETAPDCNPAKRRIFSVGRLLPEDVLLRRLTEQGPQRASASTYENGKKTRPEERQAGGPKASRCGESNESANRWSEGRDQPARGQDSRLEAKDQARLGRQEDGAQESVPAADPRKSGGQGASGSQAEVHFQDWNAAQKDRQEASDRATAAHHRQAGCTG